MPRYKLNAFDRELIATIQNEELNFDMSRWRVQGAEKSDFSCNTAACMGGHIVCTLRPAMARALVKANPAKFANVPYKDPVNYEDLAIAIYEAETGQPCTLDFHTENTPVQMEDPSRKDAIAHVRGNSKRWPRLRFPSGLTS